MTDDAMRFFREFARAPLSVGAIAPSSAVLARHICAAVPESGDPVVVELGPGTGAFTDVIQRRLGGRGHHLAVELNPVFANRLADRYPGVDIAVGDAAHLGDLLGERGLGRADVIVSGLPWAAFSARRQGSVLDAVRQAMAPDGAFTTFAYVHALWAPPARRLRSAVRTAFEEVVIGRTVWRNVPPRSSTTPAAPGPSPAPRASASCRTPGVCLFPELEVDEGLGRDHALDLA
ncbi:class I SAM-dependent methyltransferase [Phytohabitans suffuscus]|uniref:class I SAM-dependent methyltransferase n=1 Tax=Phytohabitans suffuscus TaxID=624315 RepID=UPI0018D70BC5|nr:SAM-dependent methyltransferase [Phytohabitans suffuscus]